MIDPFVGLALISVFVCVSCFAFLRDYYFLLDYWWQENLKLCGIIAGTLAAIVVVMRLIYTLLPA